MRMTGASLFFFFPRPIGQEQRGSDWQLVPWLGRCTMRVGRPWRGMEGLPYSWDLASLCDDDGCPVVLRMYTWNASIQGNQRRARRSEPISSSVVACVSFGFFVCFVARTRGVFDLGPRHKGGCRAVRQQYMHMMYVLSVVDIFVSGTGYLTNLLSGVAKATPSCEYELRVCCAGNLHERPIRISQGHTDDERTRLAYSSMTQGLAQGSVYR
jgi:hypothetical protein